MSYSKNGKFGVYCIVCRQKDKIYVGSSKCMESRVKIHFRLLRDGNHPNKEIQNDYLLYPDTFAWSPLEYTADYKVREKEWIKILGSSSKEFGYNSNL